MRAKLTALPVFAGQRDQAEDPVQPEVWRLQEGLLADPALVLPPAGPAGQVALPALQAGALDDLAAVRAGDLPDQLLQHQQASAGHCGTWDQRIVL